jgi:hypothetical protein
MNSLRCIRLLTSQSTWRRSNVNLLNSRPRREIPRRFASTSTALVPKERSVLLGRPTREQLEESDLDLEVLREEEASVVITQRAAEVSFILILLLNLR